VLLPTASSRYALSQAEARRGCRGKGSASVVGWQATNSRAMAVMGGGAFPHRRQPASEPLAVSRTAPPSAGDDERKSESGHVIGVTPFVGWHIPMLVAKPQLRWSHACGS
jgi:hypothetical protein